MEGWVDLDGWVHTETVYLSADSHPQVTRPSVQQLCWLRPTCQPLHHAVTFCLILILFITTALLYQSVFSLSESTSINTAIMHKYCHEVLITSWRKKWVDIIKRDLKDMNLTWEDTETLANDEAEWRQSVTQCTHLDVGWTIKKGKADHTRMGVGGVLISLTLAVSP